jgi:hypothetical protein
LPFWLQSRLGDSTATTWLRLINLAIGPWSWKTRIASRSNECLRRESPAALLAPKTSPRAPNHHAEHIRVAIHTPSPSQTAPDSTARLTAHSYCFPTCSATLTARNGIHRSQRTLSPSPALPSCHCAAVSTSRGITGLTDHHTGSAVGCRHICSCCVEEDSEM